MSAPFGLATLGRIGTGLRRPECVLATLAGDLYAPQLGAGVVHIAPDGRQRTIGSVSHVDGQPWIPNGIALLDDGFLVANVGPAGGLWKLSWDGTLSLVLDRVDGRSMSTTNFVMQDSTNRVWVTVTTEQSPRSKAYTALGAPTVDDGYVALLDRRGARIVAEGCAFTNELRLDVSQQHAYVVETFGRRITRWHIGHDGALSRREVFTTFGHGDFIDGAAFDAEGHLWVAGIVSNRLWRVAPDGRKTLMLEDADTAHVERVEAHLREGTLTAETLMATPTKRLKNLSSIAFGGPDLRSIYLGSLGGDHIACLRSPVAGAAYARAGAMASITAVR